MQIRPLKIGNIEAELPIIQGGMGVGISLGGLAGAVAREGGVGVISAAQIGYREPDFNRNTREANLRAVKKEYLKARALAPEGVIGFNIMVAMKGYEDYVRAAIEAGADLIISGAGLPTELPKIAAGTDVKLAPIVSTARAAKVILKYWDKKYKRTPDLLIIEGPLAGGHLGFTREQLEGYLPGESGLYPEAYDREVKEILSVVNGYEERYERQIPTALGGGIRNQEQAAHGFSLGVDAIQVASRFVTTEECDADIRYKEAYIRASREDIVIVKSPVGMPGRAIKNPFIQKVMEGEKIPHGPCRGCLEKCDPANTPYCITEALIRAVRGEVEEGLLFCGAYAYEANHIGNVREVMESLLPEGSKKQRG